MAHSQYFSRLSSSRDRGAGFHPGDSPDDVYARTREYGERPHGWGNFESNYDLASSELRRVDVSGSARTDQHGKGPKDYRRSDERLNEIACQLLTDDPDIDATDIEVRVESGEITLTGFVDSRRTKFLVEDLLATSIHGEITNRLQIRRPQDP